MTVEGQYVWSYKSDNFKNPLALDTDFNDNIYVAGNESRNIHVLSNSGELIRLIDNIPSPLSCKTSNQCTFIGLMFFYDQRKEIVKFPVQIQL